MTDRGSSEADGPAESGDRREPVIRIDPHVKILDEDVVDRAITRGLDALVYAPHFTRLPEIQRRAAVHTTEDLLVVPGREVFTGHYRNRQHVLAIGLEEPVPDFVSLEAAMAEFERQDATVLVPHPEYLTIGLAEAAIRRYCDVIDAVEVSNPKHLARDDRRARALADELGLPAFGSSYAHLRWTVGDVWTEFDADAAAAVTGADNLADGAPAATEEAPTWIDGATAATDGRGSEHGSARGAGSEPNGGEERSRRSGLDGEAAVTALLRDADRRVCRRRGGAADLRARAELAHVAWENTWKKFDRVVLSGREPTHPRHPAYAGRFDDAAVY